MRHQTSFQRSGVSDLVLIYAPMLAMIGLLAGAVAALIDVCTADRASVGSFIAFAAMLGGALLAQACLPMSDRRVDRRLLALRQMQLPADGAGESREAA